jgi:TRAP-type C4-dicarboxylate transport system permease small subunit
MNEPNAAPATDEHVLDAEGHFHVEDAPVDLGHYVVEDWASLGFFWLLGLCVFYQFFTRYALNDSAAWTEEISRYLLIATVFIGIAAATRRTRHIHVDFVYRMLPAPAGRALSTIIDVLRIGFFATAVVLTIEMMTRMTYMKMTIIELPMNIVFAVCAVGFAAATFRSVQVLLENWKRGYSVLEKPEAFIDEVIK